MFSTRKVINVVILLSCILVSILIYNVGRPENSKVQISEKGEIVNLSSLTEFYSLDNALIYFGKEACADCQVFAPLLQEIVSEEQIQIFYFDTDFFREETSTSEDELQAVFSAYNVESVPTIVEIKNSELGMTFTIGGFDDSNESVIKEKIKDFILSDINLNISEGFPEKYIPQYTIQIILLLLVIAMLTFILAGKNIINSRNLNSSFFVFTLGVVIITFANLKSTINMLDTYLLSGSEINSLCMIATFTISFIIIIVLFKRLRNLKRG